MKTSLTLLFSLLATLPALPQAAQILEPPVTAAEHGYASESDFFEEFALEDDNAFGQSLSADQGTLLVGAPGKPLIPSGGVVYRYQFDVASRTWSFDEAVGLNNMKGGRFGSGVATEGGRFLIGMSEAATFGNGQQINGMAFFAEHADVANGTFGDPSNDGTDIVSFGYPDLDLYSNNMVLGRSNDNSLFGAAVDFSGDTAIVGAPLNLDAGTAFIYEYDEVADLGPASQSISPMSFFRTPSSRSRRPASGTGRR